MQAVFLKKRVDQAEFYISVLIAFLLPVHQKLVIPLIALLCLVSIFNWIRFGTKKLSFQTFPFIILFVIYLIGLLFSVNYDYGFKDIETRLSFVIFPLLYGLNKRKTELDLRVIIGALVLGALVAIAKNYYFAYKCFLRDCYIECFEGSRLSEGMHPSYFATYLVAAGAFFLLTRSKWKSRSWFYITRAGIVLGFCFMVYRLYSLGTWIGFLGMLGGLLFACSHFKGQKRYFFIGMLGMGLAGIIAVSTLPFLKNDYQEVKRELSAYFENPEGYVLANQDDPHSTNARILIWITSVDFITGHPFGVGTGDYKDELKKYYRARGMHKYAEKELNSHNQYLQTAASVGIMSSVLLICIMVYYLWIGFNRRNLYLIALVTLFAVSCLFESMLERQWGILFFMFFLAIFLEHKPNSTGLENHKRTGLKS